MLLFWPASCWPPIGGGSCVDSFVCGVGCWDSGCCVSGSTACGRLSWPDGGRFACWALPSSGSARGVGARPAAEVALDVWRGLVGVEEARRDYGVVVAAGVSMVAVEMTGGGGGAITGTCVFCT